ncbi:MAG TPA: hypothetical protein VKV03_14595 [Candidatus Binataceae bacterium]|nr:hypothetical protein [Candidatus Binataceae bacterium]
MPDMSDDAVRSLAGKILARPEYAGAVGLNAKAESQLLKWLEAILKPISRLEVLRSSSPLLYWMIVIAIAGICGALIAHVTWTIATALRAPEPSQPSREFGGNLPDLEREADSLAASGRYLDAAHRLMLACFRTLAERSVIELRPDRSNRWIRAALRGSALAENLAVEIDTLVERTERRWFGDRQNDPEIYARWRSAFEQLSSQAQ